MGYEEKAPPFESWADHLKALGDRELAELATDYRWLEDENTTAEERPEFHRRREAVAGELERRGMTELANACRPTRAGAGS